MIDKLFGSIAQAVDTGHPFWLALLGVVSCLLFIFVVVVVIGIATAHPLEPDED